MGFSKTIIQRFSNVTPLSFLDFVKGTISLIQYAINNNLNLRVNLEGSPFADFLIVENYDTRNFPVTTYYGSADTHLLYTNLETFREDTSALFVVSTGWFYRGYISDHAVREFKTLIQFTPAIYNQAIIRSAVELLNINFPHVDPIIPVLLPQNIRPYGDVILSSEYSVIYVDISSDTHFNYLNTVKLADYIRSSMLFDKNILLLSSDKCMKIWLSEMLTVNYIPEVVNQPFVPLNSWTLEDDITNLVIISGSKKLYVFSDKSLPVEKNYSVASKLLNTSVQHFTFFYTKVEISPMPSR